MRLSPSLKISKEVDPNLGEIIFLFSPKTTKGKAYFIRFEDGEEIGMGMRITKRTALKLGTELLKLARSK